MGSWEEKLKKDLRRYEYCSNAQHGKLLWEKMKADEKAGERRASLKAYAESFSGLARKGQTTDCDAFVAVVAQAAVLVSNLKPVGCHEDLPAFVMVEDLKEVLIGEGFRTDERNRGSYALKYQAFLDTGFKPEFQDGGNQVQHAMAGIAVCYKYGLVGKKFLLWQEDEEADTKLYKAVCSLGTGLNDDNYMTLHKRIEEAIRAPR